MHRSMMNSQRASTSNNTPSSPRHATRMLQPVNVYSNSRKGSQQANGRSSSGGGSATTTTVILSPEQVDLLNLNNKAEAPSDLVVIPAAESTQQQSVFVCPEESLFYSQCIEGMVVSRPDCPSRIVEFGAGDGSPVISALLKSPKSPAQMPSIHAYEISPAAAALASTRAAAVGLGDVYSVHNSCFWTGAVKEGRPHEDTCLIANPPYIPAPDASQLLMPALWGGEDGANLTRQLLSAGFSSAMLLISGYSNPILTLQHARDQGYIVADFLVQPLPFGTYSSQPLVVEHLAAMRARGEAFYREGSGSRLRGGAGGGVQGQQSRRPYYFLAGVLFQKVEEGSSGAEGVVDLSEELLSVLCAL